MKGPQWRRLVKEILVSNDSLFGKYLHKEIIIGEDTFGWDDGTDGFWSSNFIEVVGGGCPIYGCTDSGIFISIKLHSMTHIKNTIHFFITAHRFILYYFKYIRYLK